MSDLNPTVYFVIAGFDDVIDLNGDVCPGRIGL